MATDGTLKFDTKVETSGMKKDLESVGTVAKGVFAADVVEAFAAKAATALAGLAKGAIEVGSNFETAMSQVAATMGITADEIAAGNDDFEKLSAAAKEMGATTKYTAAEAAEGLNILAMAGLSADEAIETLPSVLALAAAGAMDMGTAASYVTGAVKGFADSMDNADMYADIMAKGATMANTDVNALGAALSGAAASANAYGQSVDTTTLALLRLAEQNVTGQEAATAMNRAMADLYTPTANAAKALEELGVATYDSNGDARDFNDVIDDLNASLQGMTQEEKLSYENLIFTTYGMKAFQKMTVSSAETVERFAEGIAEASGSAMQQMNTQIDNLEGKLAILNSATEAVGISFYEIFEDTMKNAVDHASDAMTNFQKEMTSGKLSVSLERLATAVGNFADRAIDTAEDILPALVDGLTWILDHGSEIAAALEGIGTGFLVFKTVSGVMTIAQTAMSLFSLATGEATIQQIGLNTAMEANPIGLVAGLLAGLTVAVVAYAKSVDEANTYMSDTTQKTNELVEASNSLNESIQSSADARAKERESYAEEDQLLEQLGGRFEELTTKETLTADEQRELSNIIEQLNAAYPDLNLSLDENSQLVGTNTDEVLKNIDALKQQARAQAAKEDLEEIAAEQYEAEKKLFDLENQMEDQKRDLADAEAELTAATNDSTTAFETNGQSITDAQLKAGNSRKAYESLQAEYEATKKTLDDLDNEYQVATDFMNENSEAAGDVEDANEAVQESNEALAESYEETTAAIENMTDAQQEAYEDLNETVQSSVEKQTSLFGDFDDATEATFTNIKKRLEDQITAMQDWATNIQTLADAGINEGLLAELEEMGPEGAAYVQQFVQMSSDELAEINSLYVQKAALEDSTVLQVTGSWAQAATSNVEGYTATVSQETIQAALAGDAVAKATLEGVKNSDAWSQLTEETQNLINAALESAVVPSKAQETGNQIGESTLDGLTTSDTWAKMAPSIQEKILAATTEAQTGAKEGAEKDGEAVTEGVATGIENSTDKVTTAATTMTQATVDAINTAAGTQSGSSTETEKTGEGIAQGLADGMTSGTQTVETAATNTGTAATTAIDDTVNSNSSVYNDGKQLDVNLANGMLDNIDVVKQAASEVAKAAKSGVQEGATGSSGTKSNSAGSFQNLGAQCIVDFTEGMKQEAGNLNASFTQTQATAAVAKNAAVQPANVTVENHVTLEGDANRLFTAIVNKNADFVRTTGIAPLNLSPA